MELWRRKASDTFGKALTSGDTKLDGVEIFKPKRGEQQPICGRQMESNLHRGSVLPPCTSLLVSVLVGVSGAEAQAPNLSLRERTMFRYGNSLKKSGHGNWWCTRENPGHTREIRHHYRAPHEERGETTRRISITVSTLRQDTAYRSSRCRDESLLPS